MIEEIKNLVLVQSRSIREMLESVDARFNRMDGRFDKLDEDNTSFRSHLTNAYGAATLASTRAQRAEEKADDALALGKRTDERLADVERRLKALEVAKRKQ